MALARSASGPGGLSINTGTANSLFGSNNNAQATNTSSLFGNAQTSQPAGGLFGSSTATATTTTTAPQSGGLFGAATTSQPAQTGGLFGGATTSQPAQSGGLFGSTATTQPAPAGGLFGNTTTTQAAQSGGLFGNTATTQPAQSGGLFGNAATTQPAQSGGLFGNTTTSQPAQTGGLFGAAKPAQPATGGLFGNTSTATTQAGGLFGSAATTTTSAPAAGGLFGNTNAQKPATNLFGAAATTAQAAPRTLFGSTQPAQAQTPSLFGGLAPSQAQAPSTGLKLGSTMASQAGQSVPGVKIDLSNLRSTTRFNDLHEDLQKEIEAIDKVIQQQGNLKQECEAIMPSHDEQLSSVPRDVEFLTRKQNGMEEALSADVAAISGLRNFVATDADHAKLSFKVIDNLKLPVQYHYHNSAAIWSGKSENGDANSQDLVSFFSSGADEMKTRLDEYRNTLAQIEQHLHGVEADTRSQLQQLASNGEAAHGSDLTLQQLQLVATLRELEESVLWAASKVGKSREAMQQLQLGGFARAETPGSKRRGVY